jgi:hypothetical protein
VVAHFWWVVLQEAFFAEGLASKVQILFIKALMQPV